MLAPAFFSLHQSRDGYFRAMTCEVFHIQSARLFCVKGRHFSATLIEELKAWRLTQAQEFLRLGIRPNGETFVVTQADGRPLQPRSLTHEWVRVIKAKGLPRIRFHDLRHAHATHLLASGVHPKIASERLGHSKVGITLDLYSHVMPGMQEEAASRVDDALRAVMKRS